MDEINKGGLAKSIYERAQCLPLLPAKHIRPAFKDMAVEANKLDDKVAFRPFMRLHE